MQLNQQQVDRLFERITGYWGTRPCDICSSTAGWWIGDKLFALTGYSPGAAYTLPTSVIPLAAVYCKTCGNLRLLNALTLGVIDPNTGEWVNG